MTDHLPPYARALLGAAALALPALLLLLVLSIQGTIAPVLALSALLAVFGVPAGLCLLHLRHLRRLADRLAPGQGEGQSGPQTQGLLAPELDRAVAEARRRWKGRIEALAAGLSGAEAIFANLPDPLVMLDRRQTILRANRAAEALLGEGLAGRELAAALRNPALLEAAAGALSSGQGRIAHFSLPIPVERHFSAQIEPLSTPLPDGSAAVLALHDVTALRRADQMRVDFVANASHELRTPLSTLIGFLETLAGPAKDDPAARARFLPIMLDQARRMARLISDLLSLSRIELNEHTPPTGQVDLGRVLVGVVDALELKARERGMTIALEQAALPAVAGDADELAQVFQNLIDNAIKYGRPDTPIRVVAGRVVAGPVVAGPAPPEGAGRTPRRFGREGVAVSVIDQGDGIRREHLPRLTERFYRVDSARSRELGGTGLGLAIVKHIVNRHRGHLEIDSTQGQGSRFTVILRAAAREPPTPTPAPAAAPPAPA